MTHAMEIRESKPWRFEDNPSERALAQLFQDEVRPLLPHILSSDNEPVRDLTDRDRAVAGRVVQWLATPVGSSFLEKALAHPDAEDLRRRLGIPSR